MVTDTLKYSSVISPVERCIFKVVVGGVVVDCTTTPLTQCWVMHITQHVTTTELCPVPSLFVLSEVTHQP